VKNTFRFHRLSATSAEWRCALRGLGACGPAPTRRAPFAAGQPPNFSPGGIFLFRSPLVRSFLIHSGQLALSVKTCPFHRPLSPPSFTAFFDVCRMAERPSWPLRPADRRRLDERPSRPAGRLPAELLGETTGAEPFCETIPPTLMCSHTSKVSRCLTHLN
jgi:hypothetical protein